MPGHSGTSGLEAVVRLADPFACIVFREGTAYRVFVLPSFVWPGMISARSWAGASIVDLIVIAALPAFFLSIALRSLLWEGELPRQSSKSDNPPNLAVSLTGR